VASQQSWPQPGRVPDLEEAVSHTGLNANIRRPCRKIVQLPPPSSATSSSVPVPWCCQNYGSQHSRYYCNALFYASHNRRLTSCKECKTTLHVLSVMLVGIKPTQLTYCVTFIGYHTQAGDVQGGVTVQATSLPSTFIINTSLSPQIS